MFGHRRHHRTRVHLTPTLAGWLFLGVGILLGMAAIKSQAPLTFVLFGGMFGTMLVSGIVAREMVRSVSLQREVPERVWENQTSHLSYYLRNENTRRSCLGLKVEELDAKGVDFAPGYCLHLEGDSVFRSGTRFAPRRRGGTELNRVRLSTIFPFGLMQASKVFHRDKDILVWCARGTLKRELLHRGAVESSSNDPAPVQGGQDEFFGLREYRSGDNPRWIHWRRSATRDKPVVREMARPFPEILCVIVDTFSPDASDPDRNALEKMLRFAGTLVDYALAKGYKVGLSLGYQDRIEVRAPAGGIYQRRKVLDALAQADLNTTHPLGETLRSLDPQHLRDAQVIVLVPNSAGLSRDDILSVSTTSRSVSVIGADQLSSFFDDNPLIEKESP